MGRIDVPFLGTVPTGSWDDSTGELVEVPVPVSLSLDGLVAVRVVGDALAPRVLHGQLVLLRLESHPREGVISLVRGINGDATLKVPRLRSGGWDLYPLNPEYPVEPLDGWTVVGHVVGLYEIDGAGLRP